MVIGSFKNSVHSAYLFFTFIMLYKTKYYVQKLLNRLVFSDLYYTVYKGSRK